LVPRELSSSAGEVGDVLQEHVVVAALEGDMERLRDFAERVRRAARLTRWHRLSVRDGTASVRLSIYSAPDRPSAGPGDACAHPRSKVWLWPYTARVGHARSEVDRLCAELGRHHATRVQVDDFRAKKSRLEDLVNAIERIRDRSPVPEVVRDAEAAATAKRPAYGLEVPSRP
jgi:hypothetical protein